LDAIANTEYIGWVDTSLWAQVIDVFLDTWPFGSGHTAWEAIAANKHFVSMEADDRAEQCFVHGLMKRHSARHVAAIGAADYVNLALAMADGSIDARTDYQTFYREHMRDEQRMAREFTLALMGITDARDF
jgi:predicted O-linked N-acetylglucosamine transferase (SPINDLY family)